MEHREIHPTIERGGLEVEKRYITAVATHTRGLSDILDYLYSNTMIVASGQSQYFDGMILLVQGSVNPDGLAHAQTDRLFHGKYAIRVYRDLDDAIAALRELYDVQVETR